jgi:hypothetical protein
MSERVKHALVIATLALFAIAVSPPDAFAAKRKPVYKSPVRVVDKEYDWRTDTYTEKTEGTTTYDSAQDPDRFDAVPGTRKKVDRVVKDKDGQLVRETGVIWQSPSGKTHGNIKRQKTNPTGGEHTEKVHFYRTD